MYGVGAGWVAFGAGGGDLSAVRGGGREGGQTSAIAELSLKREILVVEIRGHCGEGAELALQLWAARTQPGIGALVSRGGPAAAPGCRRCGGRCQWSVGGPMWSDHCPVNSSRSIRSGSSTSAPWTSARMMRPVPRCSDTLLVVPLVLLRPAGHWRSGMRLTRSTKGGYELVWLPTTSPRRVWGEAEYRLVPRARRQCQDVSSMLGRLRRGCPAACQRRR